MRSRRVGPILALLRDQGAARGWDAPDVVGRGPDRGDGATGRRDGRESRAPSGGPGGILALAQFARARRPRAAIARSHRRFNRPEWTGRRRRWTVGLGGSADGVLRSGQSQRCEPGRGRPVRSSTPRVSFRRCTVWLRIPWPSSNGPRRRRSGRAGFSLPTPACGRIFGR